MTDNELVNCTLTLKVTHGVEWPNPIQRNPYNTNWFTYFDLLLRVYYFEKNALVYNMKEALCIIQKLHTCLMCT